MIVTEIRGNVFTAPKNAMFAHCIAADAGMGRGIAVDFVKFYPQIKRLRQMDLKVGTTYFVEPVFNLVTKRRSAGKPSYESMETTLRNFKECALAEQASLIAMPRIGCGLDRLSWPAVKALVECVFKDTEIAFWVYKL